MREFLAQLRELMLNIDQGATSDDHSITVLGCEVAAIPRRGRSIGFLAGKFALRANGTYDIQRASALLIKALPQLLKRKKAQEAAAASLQTMQEFVAGLRPGVEYKEGAWCPVLEQCYVRHSEGEYTVMIRTKSLVDIGAILDILQEYGLVMPVE